MAPPALRARPGQRPRRRVASAGCRSQCSGRRDDYRLDRARTGDPRIVKREQLLGRDTGPAVRTRTAAPPCRVPRDPRGRRTWPCCLSLHPRAPPRADRAACGTPDRWPARRPCARRGSPHLHQCRRRAGHRVGPPFGSPGSRPRRARPAARRASSSTRDRICVGPPAVMAAHRASFARPSRRWARSWSSAGISASSALRPTRSSYSRESAPAGPMNSASAAFWSKAHSMRKVEAPKSCSSPMRRAASPASARPTAVTALKSSRRSRVDVFARDSKCEHRHARAIWAVTREAW